MSDVVTYIVTVTFGLLFIATGCAISLLAFWYLGRKDIKEYLNGNSSNSPNKNKKR